MSTSMLSALSPKSAEKYDALMTDGKELASNGQLPEALEALRQARDICPTKKVQKRIEKLEVFIKENAVEGEEEEEEEMIEVTPGFSLYHEIYNKLFNHQRQGVAWMYGLYKKKKGGVLGDDMGLGKTFQVIAFLSGMIDASLIKHILIIMPVSLLPNWKKEFERWCPGISVYEFHGSAKKAREQNLIRVQRRGGVLLTSYGMVVTNVGLMDSIDGRAFIWDYVVLDEGHKIKNPTKTTKAVHEIPARNRIVLTGTPIQNNLRELWALYDFTHHGTLLGSRKTFQMQYETPITRSREKDATLGEKKLGTEMATSLKHLINPYFLRRTKEEISNQVQNVQEKNNIDTLSDSLQNMKLSARKNDFIVWLFLSNAQHEIYTSFLQSASVKQILVEKRSPLVELTVLKKICDHPRLLSIKACMQLGLNGEMSNDELMREIEDERTSASSIENVSDETLIDESGKLNFAIQLLEHLRETKHRTLVFSLSRKILDMIQRILIHKNWKVLRIDGTITKMEERHKRVQLFQNDPSFPVCLLTTQVGGVGITLTAADRVIIYDPSWNPATDSQAVDRVYRIGQNKNVVIYRLITCGTVEEKIYRTQIFKDSITRQATGSKDPHRYFSKQELRELFAVEDIYYSTTQVQLAQMHSGERTTDTSLDEHLAYVHSLNIFGISDHNLMFSKHVKDPTEDQDEGAVSTDYIKRRVQMAQMMVRSESSVIEEGMRQAGSYVKPFSLPIPSFSKKPQPPVADYRPMQFPEVVDLTQPRFPRDSSPEVMVLSESRVSKNYTKVTERSFTNEDSSSGKRHRLNGISSRTSIHQEETVNEKRNLNESIIISPGPSSLNRSSKTSLQNSETWRNSPAQSNRSIVQDLDEIEEELPPTSPRTSSLPSSSRTSLQNSETWRNSPAQSNRSIAQDLDGIGEELLPSFPRTSSLPHSSKTSLRNSETWVNSPIRSSVQNLKTQKNMSMLSGQNNVFSPSASPLRSSRVAVQSSEEEGPYLPLATPNPNMRTRLLDDSFASCDNSYQEKSVQSRFSRRKSCVNRRSTILWSESDSNPSRRTSANTTTEIVVADSDEYSDSEGSYESAEEAKSVTPDSKRFAPLKTPMIKKLADSPLNKSFSKEAMIKKWASEVTPNESTVAYRYSPGLSPIIKKSINGDKFSTPATSGKCSSPKRITPLRVNPNMPSPSNTAFEKALSASKELSPLNDLLASKNKHPTENIKVQSGGTNKPGSVSKEIESPVIASVKKKAARKIIVSESSSDVDSSEHEEESEKSTPNGSVYSASSGEDDSISNSEGNSTESDSDGGENTGKLNLKRTQQKNLKARCHISDDDSSLSLNSDDDVLGQLCKNVEDSDKRKSVIKKSVKHSEDETHSDGSSFDSEESSTEDELINQARRKPASPSDRNSFKLRNHESLLEMQKKKTPFTKAVHSKNRENSYRYKKQNLSTSGSTEF